MGLRRYTVRTDPFDVDSLTTTDYQPLRGFFLQDDPESEDGVALPPRFGLKDDRDDRWAKFKEEIQRLKVGAPPGTQYKIIFLGRHGEGYHNVAMSKYTTEEWTSWSRLDGDGELVWGPDPELTELGVEQAKDVNRVWKKEIEYDIPLPEKLYSSPLRRAIKTNQVTFEGLLRLDLKTTIVENIREKNSVSTCDKRRRKSEIVNDFPDYLFEEGFSEEDVTWDPDNRETKEELDARAEKVLDTIFEDDKEQFISITTHHGFIDAFLRGCGHRPWDLPTGGVIPMVLRTEQLLSN